METLKTLDVQSWNGPFPKEIQETSADALESGLVLYFPALPFAVKDSERDCLTANVSDGKAKNISLDPTGDKIQGAGAEGELLEKVHGMVRRFADSAENLVHGLIPHYASRIERGRTSYRAVEIQGRSTSPRKDDKLLHVDAFPSRPIRGRRIMRVFCNVDPNGKERVWNVGEPFADCARRFVPRIHPPNPAIVWAMASLGLTKGPRTSYDHYMLSMHDTMKLDAAYQKDSPHERVLFKPGVTWICFTDQVLHAALAGQFALEQTFYLDVDAMAAPDRSPLRVLEKMIGQTLV